MPNVAGISNYLTALVLLAVFCQPTWAIICYNFTSSTANFPSYAPTMQGCNACTRTISIYRDPNTGNLRLSRYTWGCTWAGPIAPGMPGSPYARHCIGSQMQISYTDGSMYSASCGCCTDMCNDSNYPCGNSSPTGSSSSFAVVVTTVLAALQKAIPG